MANVAVACVQENEGIEEIVTSLNGILEDFEGKPVLNYAYNPHYHVDGIIVATETLSKDETAEKFQAFLDELYGNDQPV
jgi:hypothetical protein